MYDIVQAIIDHIPSSTYSTNYEQIVTTICGCIIIMVFIIVVDMVYRVFKNFIG